jgi:hypothetical protein
MKPKKPNWNKKTEPNQKKKCQTEPKPKKLSQTEKIKPNRFEPVFVQNKTETGRFEPVSVFF